MVVKLFINQTFTRPFGTKGNLRNVFFERVLRWCQTVKIFLGNRLNLFFQLNKEKNTKKEKTASNGRFGVMAAVAPRKRQCGFETLSPAGTVVEAATTPSRWDVSGKREATSHFEREY